MRETPRAESSRSESRVGEVDVGSVVLECLRV